MGLKVVVCEMDRYTLLDKQCFNSLNIHARFGMGTRAPKWCPVGDSVKHEGVVRHRIVPNSQDRNQADMHELTPTSEK